jgi:hypothetical protein
MRRRWRRYELASFLQMRESGRETPHSSVPGKGEVMFNIRAWGPALLLLALFIAVLMMPAKANTPYKFLDDRTQAGNDQQRLLNTVVTHYGLTRDRLEPIVKSLGRIETELPTLLFMADESGKPVETILELRRTQRLGWIEVMRKAGVKLNVLFEGVEGRFPEPYKASWTEWRMKYKPELTDDQIRELVFLQLAHRISGRPVAELVRTPTLPTEVLAQGKPSPRAQAATKARETEEDEPKPAKGKARPPAKKKPAR